MRTKYTLAALVLALGIGLAACSSSSPSSNGTTTTTTTDAQAVQGQGFSSAIPSDWSNVTSQSSADSTAGQTVVGAYKPPSGNDSIVVFSDTYLPSSAFAGSFAGATGSQTFSTPVSVTIDGEQGLMATYTAAASAGSVILIDHNNTTYDITASATSQSEYQSVIAPAQQTLIQNWKWSS
jgi:hypothetical protein